MVDEQFKSMSDLYARVFPALKSKKKELILKKINFINEKDIWIYLRESKWKNETNLTLFDIVNDILTIEDKELISYKYNFRENK